MINKLQSFAVFNGNRFNVRDLNMQQVSEVQIYVKAFLMECYGTFDINLLDQMR